MNLWLCFFYYMDTVMCIQLDLNLIFWLLFKGYELKRGKNFNSSIRNWKQIKLFWITSSDLQYHKCAWSYLISSDNIIWFNALPQLIFKICLFEGYMNEHVVKLKWLTKKNLWKKQTLFISFIFVAEVKWIEWKINQ